MSFLQGIDWSDVAEGILITVGSAIILGCLVIFRKQLWKALVGLAKFFGQRILKFRCFLHLRKRIFCHKRYIRHLARENRQLRAQLREAEGELQELRVEDIKKDPQLTETHLKLLKTIATWPYHGKTLSMLAEVMKWNFDYMLCIFLELEALGFVGHYGGERDASFWLSDQGRMALWEMGILTERGIVG